MNHRPIILFVRRPALAIMTVIAVLLILGCSVRIVKTIALGTKNKVIVIDAGHGGQDPGAQYGGVNEKDINLVSVYETGHHRNKTPKVLKSSESPRRDIARVEMSLWKKDRCNWNYTFKIINPEI